MPGERAAVDYGRIPSAKSVEEDLTVETWQRFSPRQDAAADNIGGNADQKADWNDYAEGADKVFLMIKTGNSVLWERLPQHMHTTLQRFPRFALYSDAPASVGGYEVIDILANMSEAMRARDDFDMWRRQKLLHDENSWAPARDMINNTAWELDRFKNIPMLAHAYRTAPLDTEWFVFMDADTYVMADALMAMLNMLDPAKPIYMGSAAGSSTYMWFAHGGSGVVLSRRAMDLTFGSYTDLEYLYEDLMAEQCCGDLSVGIMVWDTAKVQVVHNAAFRGDPHHKLRITSDMWCQPVATFHHASGMEHEIIHQYETSKRASGGALVTFADVYRDFYLPYLEPEKPGWYNAAIEEPFIYSRDRDISHGIKPLAEGGLRPRPYESLDNCRQACTDSPECMIWQYYKDHGNATCALGNVFRYGHSLKHYRKLRHMTDATAGWMIDRLRATRNSSSCDGLFDTVDGQDRSEGWLVRSAHFA